MADPAHSSPTAAAAGDSLLAPDAPAEAVLPAAAAPDLDAEFGFQRPELGKEKLAGTVGFHQRHVFLCYKGPEEWPSHVEATDSDRLPRLLAAAIKARKSNLKKSTKLTICEGEDGTESSLGDVLIFPDMIRYRGLTHFDVDNFVEEVLVKDVEWLPGSPEAIRGSYVFVCVHGSRDKRCGVCGPALITRFKEEIEGQGLDGQVAVSACSHVGGHKYAGNVIIFSSDAKGEVTGHWYGYVAPDDVPVLLHKHIGQGEIVDHLWRGQFGIIEEQQKEDCNPAPAGGCCQSSGGGFTCCQSDLPEEKQDKSVPAEKHKRYKSISQNRTVVGSSKDLLGKDDDALFRKREWKELATKFLDVYYKTLKESPELLHHLYSENCDVNWVLEESYQMRTPQEVQDRISSLIKSQQNSNFWKKKHHIQKNGKTIHVVAHGIFKAEKNCNFVQSFVLHRQTGAICNDVLLVLANAKSVNFTVERSSIVAATEERNEDVEAGPSYTNLEATEMGKREVMLVYNEQCLDHVPLGPHVEHPTRISLIMDRLQKDGVLGRVLRTGSRPAFKEELLAVHSERHISIIDNFPLTAKELQLCAYISNINDMYTSSGTKTAVYLAAGAVIKACEAVVKGDVKRAFALVRPPGHHASAEFSEGFCFVNNAAIAARYVLNLLENVMLVDIDVHHGNGSQRVFYDSDSVLVFSTHRSDMGYPSAASKEKILSPVHTSLGDGNGKGFNVNVPMKKGFGDSEILLAIDEILAPLVKAFNPGLILVSAGFDAADGDALGGCKVSSKCFGTITKKLMEMGNGKLVMCLEGGYGSALPGCVSHCIRALLGDTDVCLSEEEIRCLPAPSQDAIDTVRKLKKLLNKVWNIFSK